MPSPAVIRDARDSDMDAVQRIYTPYVLHGLATFEETPPSEVELLLRRQQVLSAGLPYLVAALDGQVVGYAYATLYRVRAAYRHTVEDSVYVADSFHGRGIGRALLTEVITRCEATDRRQMIAIIGDSGDAASIALHQRLGFEPIGTLRAVGFKLGQWVDTILMQRSLGPADCYPPGREST